MSSKRKEAASKGNLDTIDPNIVRVDSGEEKYEEFGDQMKVKQDTHPKEVATPVMDEKLKREAKTIGSNDELIPEEELKRQGSAANISEDPETDNVKRGIEPKSLYEKGQPITSKKDIEAAKKEGMENKSPAKSGKIEEDNLEDDGEWRWLSNLVNVFEFTVTLDYTSPRIWRKFQVLSSFTFAELHNAIHNCMGWLSCHQHEFSMPHPETRKLVRIGRSYDSIMEVNYPDIVNERETKIEDYFTNENKNAKYVYDWGDNWIHTITLDRILPIKSKATYPNCVSGECACPPEDVGGIDGFNNFLDIIKNPEHEEYEDMKQWIDDDGGYPSYDPNHFDPKKVIFQSTYIMG